ncbi:peptidoglycan-binding protein [Streptomyces sp. HC307]|uniref:peptidoglycan-binding protein n=1 Tax=Streptomyces flavusporus TaxID=3385496 RepID=UPI0039171D53
MTEQDISHSVPQDATGSGPAEGDGEDARPSHGAARSPLDRGRRIVVAVVASAVLLTAAGAVATALIKSPAQAAAETAPPPADVLTAPVERRVLTSSVILRGTVLADQTVDVTPSAGGEGGSPVVTKLPLSSGSDVRAGTLLAEVSGRPVFALRGALPVYRDLKPGSEGDDVAQLQDSLAELGHSSAPDPSGQFDAGTKTALTALYRSLGYDPLPAVADREALKTAQQQVTDMERARDDARRAVTRAQAGTGGGSESKGGTDTDRTDANGSGATADAGNDASALEDLRTQAARAEEDLAEARGALTAAQAAEGPLLPASEVVFLKSMPARVDSVSATVGSTVSGPVMKLSAGALVVHGRLQSHQKELVRPGQKVRILSELTGAESAATVASVSDEMSSGQSAEGEQGDGKQNAASGPGHLLIVKPGAPLPRDFAGQDVRLTVEAASTKKPVLVVPVTAVSSASDGRTVVTVISRNGAQRRVEVRPGTTGDGFVEVVPVGSENALGAGDNVLTGIRRSGTADTAGTAGAGTAG